MRLEQELQHYDEQLLLMLSKVKAMVSQAKKALNTNDRELALTLIETDDYINHLDEDINNQASEMLSLLQPVAKDLRAIIAGIKIATDIERIGDYSKSIGRYIIKNEPLSPELLAYVDPLFDAVLSQLDLIVECLKNLDLKLAYEIPVRDYLVDEEFNRVLTYVDKQIHLDIDNSHFPIRMVTMFRSLERAGDHIKNICESIIYRIKGQHIDFG